MHAPRRRRPLAARPRPPLGLASGRVLVRALCLAAWLASTPGAAPAAEVSEPAADLEIVELSPESPAAWGFRYLAAPVASLFRGPSYMYGKRHVRVETTPAHSYVDLFYLRSGFQKRFEQAETPVVVELPSRLHAGPRDAFKVRAFAEGYRQKSVTYRMGEDFDEVLIDLEPLPNRLAGVSHRYFAGRSAISFLTTESLTFRLQEAEDGLAVILTQTAMADEARAGIETLHSPRVEEAYGQQLGEDLMVKLVLAPSARGEASEIRSRQGYDAPRDLHAFTLDLVPADSAAADVARALDALAGISPDDVSGCALAFDDALRAALDPADLARALRPQGEFTDRYLRAAMRRLGEVSVDGVIDFTDGMQLRPQVAIELEMAINNAAAARGYLALLRSFVARLEAGGGDAPEALRSLLAPEMPGDRFRARLAGAEAAERGCLAGG